LSRSRWVSGVGMTLLATVSAGLLAAPAEAAAKGVVFIQNSNRVVYQAAKGVRNKVVVTGSGRTFTVDDVVAIKAGKRCKAVKGDKTKVKCTLPRTPSRVMVYTYDRKDTITNKAALTMNAFGGSGADTIIGGSRTDGLDGETGDDTLYGKGGNDALHGGPGRDRLYGGSGDDYLTGDDGGSGKVYADLLSGGSGTDIAAYAEYNIPVTVDLDGAKGDDGAAGEHDTVAADVESIYGGRGDDHLTGSARANFISGQAGADTIRGGAGDDYLVGLDGVDRIYGEGGDDLLYGWDQPASVDYLDGGANGTAGDWCQAPETDTLVDCER